MNDKSKMNANCLKGYRCPGCKSLGPFRMQTNCVMEWSDEGVDDGAGKFDQYFEIDDDGHAECVECGTRAPVADFDVIKRYLVTGGEVCPGCGERSTVHQSDVTETDGVSFWRDVQCSECGIRLVEEAVMTNVRVNDRA